METKKVFIFDNPDNVIDRYTIIKENGDGFVINASPFSFSKGCHGFFGNVLTMYKFKTMEDFLFEAKVNKLLVGKYIPNNNNLPDEVKKYISSL